MIGFRKRPDENGAGSGDEELIVTDLAVRKDVQVLLAAHGPKEKTPRQRSPEELLLAARSVA